MTLQSVLLPNWDGKFQPLRKELQSRPFWQYGDGDHCSDSRRILGSVILSVHTDMGSTINVCHLTIDGSSQWVIGRNVTRKCNIEHFDCNKVVLPCKEDAIALVDFDFHSYIPYEKFQPDPYTSCCETRNKIYCATAQISQILSRPWSKLRR